MLSRNTGNRRARPWKTAIMSAVAAIALTAGHTSGANANESILTPGDSIVTGFSGTVAPDTSVSPNGYFIDLDGSSAQILSLRSLDGPPGGSVSVPWSKYQLKAREIGQVFAIALDDGQDEAVPYIYFGATSYFGLEIVVPDPADDGKLKRVKIGHPDAQWMPGQFGEDGDPGAIWRVNGNTGEVTLFAVLPDNSGPGIGDIVFDEEAGQFYVSDLDTGLIYRIDADGTVIGSFDHGVDGREAAGLAEIEDDGRIADIESSSFNSADPATWGYTQKHRRIAGMAVRDGRLYYAVADGPQVWSVGITDDGRFTGDARLEFDAGKVPGAGPVTDMAFDDDGRLYLAQRGEQRVGGDYSRFAETNRSSVLRFRFVASDDNGTGPHWVQDGHHLAVGADTGHQSNGGIALGYGHDETGGLDTSEPDAMLWTTGDRLAASDDEGGEEEPLDVHGLQGTEITLLRSTDDPSSSSYFIDYDGLFGDGPKSGPVGDVEIWQPSEDAIAELEEEGIIVAEEGYAAPEGETWFPPGYAPPPDKPFDDVPYDDVPTEDVPEDSTTTDTVLKTNLKLTKRAVNRNCTLTAVGWKCKFKIRIRNTGSETYVGPIRVSDKLVKPDGATLGFSYSPNWTCWSVGAADYRCRRQVVLPSGASVRLTAVALVPLSFERCRLRNIAEIVRAPGGSRRNTNPSDDKGTAVVKIPSDECTKDPQTGWPGIDPDPIENPNHPDLTGPDPETSIPEVDEDPIPLSTNLKIEKEFVGNERPGSDPRWTTTWRITVTNTGSRTFNDVIRFEESFPAGADIASRSLVLSCSGSQCVSDGPVSLAGNASVSYILHLSGTTALARSLDCEITNRVKLIVPPGIPANNTDPSDDTASATGALLPEYCEKDELTPTRAPGPEDITTSPTPDCKPGYTLTHGECLPRAASCPSGLKTVPASRVVSLRNNGWTVRRVRQNGQVLWCGKRAEKTEHSCRKGWKQVTSKGRVPEGWRSYSVGRGDARIWCVRKADTQVQKCTRPARWNGKTCVCPGHSTWNGKRCVKQEANSKKAPTQKTATQKRCKRGYVGHPPNCRKVTQAKRRHQRTKSRRGRD